MAFGKSPRDRYVNMMSLSVFSQELVHYLYSVYFTNTLVQLGTCVSLPSTCGVTCYIHVGAFSNVASNLYNSVNVHPNCVSTLCIYCIVFRCACLWFFCVGRVGSGWVGLGRVGSGRRMIRRVAVGAGLRSLVQPRRRKHAVPVNVPPANMYIVWWWRDSILCDWNNK